MDLYACNVIARHYEPRDECTLQMGAGQAAGSLHCCSPQLSACQHVRRLMLIWYHVRYVLMRSSMGWLTKPVAVLALGSSAPSQSRNDRQVHVVFETL
jgi:hypothetical protein